MNWNDKTAANVKAIKPSGIRKFFDIAAQVKGVLSLSIGEPDFAAPDKVLAAMKVSLDAKETSYTGNSGMMELREAISHHFEQRYGVHYDPKDEILVTVGVSEGLAMALLAITEPGDEVIIPDPAYVAYPASVELAGGTPIFVPTYPEHDFKLTVEALEKVITPKTKAIVIGYPNNPTGTVMSAEELMPIAKFAEEHDLIVLSDEIYCELMYGDAKFTSFLVTIPFSVILYVMAEPIVTFIYNAPAATDATRAVAIAICFLGLHQISTAILQGLKKPKIPVINMAVACVAKVLCNWFLVAIPTLGITGASYATVADIGVAAVLNMFFIYRKIGYVIDIKVVMKNIVSAAIMGVAMYFMYAFLFPYLGLFLDLFLTCIVGSAIYIGCMVLNGGVTKEDAAKMPLIGRFF